MVVAKTDKSFTRVFSQHGDGNSFADNCMRGLYPEVYILIKIFNPFIPPFTFARTDPGGKEESPDIFDLF